MNILTLAHTHARHICRTIPNTHMCVCMYEQFAFQKLTSSHCGPESKNINRKRERERERVNAKYGRHTSRMYVCVFSFCLCFTCCCHSRRRAKVIEIARRNWKRARTTTQELASYFRTHNTKLIICDITRLFGSGPKGLVG